MPRDLFEGAPEDWIQAYGDAVNAALTPATMNWLGQSAMLSGGAFKQAAGWLADKMVPPLPKGGTYKDAQGRMYDAETGQRYYEPGTQPESGDTHE